MKRRRMGKDQGFRGDARAAGAACTGIQPLRMDAAFLFLQDVRQRGQFTGHFRGLLHILIGRRITDSEGQIISTGQTWRAAAALLKKVRWDRSAVDELDLGAVELPPRDRERYWFVVIAHADIDSEAARASAEQLIPQLKRLGYEIS